MQWIFQPSMFWQKEKKGSMFYVSFMILQDFKEVHSIHSKQALGQLIKASLHSLLVFINYIYLFLQEFVIFNYLLVFRTGQIPSRGRNMKNETNKEGWRTTQTRLCLILYCFNSQNYFKKYRIMLERSFRCAFYLVKCICWILM